MTSRPTASAVAAEAVVDLDGTGTLSIDDGPAEPITAATAAAVPYEVLYRTVGAAVERETAIELTLTLAGVPILLGVSPTGEITRFELPGAATPASSPAADQRSEPATDQHAPWSGSEPRPSIRRPRWAIAAVVGALAAGAVAGLVLMRGAEGSSPSPSAISPTSTLAPTFPVSPPTFDIVPAAAGRRLDVTVSAGKGGPLTAQVRATAAPTVATLTVWHEGRMIATRRLHLSDARATWSSGTVTFTHTGPGSYRWAATAPGAARVTGTYTVPVRPEPRDRRPQQSPSPAAVVVTPPPTQVPASSAPESPPPATAQTSTPPPPTPTRQPEQHHGPVPGGSTDSPHPGPRP